jgi:hypothetical protein
MKAHERRKGLAVLADNVTRPCFGYRPGKEKRVYARFMKKLRNGDKIQKENFTMAKETKCIQIEPGKGHSVYGGRK